MKNLDFVKLLNLKSNKDPYLLIAEMQSLNDEIDNLDIDSNIIKQFFFLRALPENLKNVLISMTNNNFPETKDILEKSFSALDRLKVTKSFKNFESKTARENVSTLATNGIEFFVNLNISSNISFTAIASSIAA